MRFWCATRVVIVWASGMLLAASSWSAPAGAKPPGAWDPHKTRAFIVSVAFFKADKNPTGLDERLDGRLVELLKKRGVPAKHIVFLKDRNATSKQIRQEFAAFLRESRPGETLWFYFGSHGYFDPKTNEYGYSTFDGSLPMTWTFNAIEKDFKGSQALLFADCCFSGGLVELAKQRKTTIAYGCISSTYCHQTATSGWRFLQCLLRGFAGNPVVDLNGDGEIDLEELARYSGRYMAGAAEGKPMFVTTNGLSRHLRIANSNGSKKSPQVGKLMDVRSGQSWYRAEILDVKGKQFRIHFTADTRSKDDRWVAADAVRPLPPPKFKVGTKVEVRSNVGQFNDKWIPAVVEETWGQLHYCRPLTMAPVYDGWFGPSGIRKAR